MNVYTSSQPQPKKTEPPSPKLAPQGPLWELWGIGILGGLSCGLWSIHYGYPKVSDALIQKMLLWHSLSAGIFLLGFGHLRFEMARRGPAAWKSEGAYVGALLLSGFLGIVAWVGLGLPGLGLWGLGGLLSGAIFVWLGPELVFWQDTTRHAAVGLAALFGLVALVFLWLWLEPWLIAHSPWLCILAATAFFAFWPFESGSQKRTLLLSLFLLGIAMAPWQLGFLRTTNLLAHARQITQGGWTLPHQDRFVVKQLSLLSTLPAEALEDIVQKLVQQKMPPQNSLQLYARVWKALSPSQQTLRAVSMGKELVFLAPSERQELASSFVKQQLHRVLLGSWLEGLYPHNPPEGRKLLAGFLLSIAKIDRSFAQLLKRRLRLATIYHRTFRPLASRMLQALGTQAPHALEQTTLLVAALLQTTHANERYRVLVALRGQSPQHLYTLRRLLQKPLYHLVMRDDTPARTTALSILYKITLYNALHPHPKQPTFWSAFSAKEITQMIYDANAVVREYALRLLNLLEPSVPKKLSHFRTLLKEDLDQSVRMTVINEAAKITTHTPQIVLFFLEALRDPDASIRYLALYNLGQRNASAKLLQPALQKLLRDPDADTRALAQKLLK